MTLFRAAALSAVVCLIPASAQVAVEANKGYQTEEDRKRVARGLDSEDREQRQKPRELLAEIGLEKGAAVADIGTGVGFMIPYFLEVIGPEGSVYAEDIQQDFLDQVEEKAKARGWKNVKTVLGGQVDPKLPEASVELAFILDAYHHFEYPIETMRHVADAIKPDGKLVMIDFYRSRKHPRMPKERLEKHIRLDRDGFAAEIEQAGFTLERQFDHLPHQYVLIFTKQ